MVREMSLEEIVFVSQGIALCTNLGTPVKTPLILVSKQIKVILDNHEKEKDVIANKYLEKDEKGRFIWKDSTKMPELITDFKCKDEKAMLVELEAITNKKFSIDFEKVSPNRPVLILKKDGITTEMPLSEYLELSGSMDAKVVAFLNQYFINE